MENVGLVTSIRNDQLLLLNKENASLAPLSRRPCHLYMLSYHRDRILAAAQAANRSYPQLEGDSGLELITDQIQQHVSGQDVNDSQALKVRFVVAPNGGVEVSSSSVPPSPQSALFPRSLDDVFKAKPSYRIYISPIKCKPSFYTRFKTTERSQYEQVRSVLPEADGDNLAREILVVNEEGDVMEGSFTTPYFNHNGTWITPAASAGGNVGVTRRWALGKALCEEGLISMGSIQVGSVGEKVVLSNGARGFGWGRVEPLIAL